MKSVWSSKSIEVCVCNALELSGSCHKCIVYRWFFSGKTNGKV